MDRRKREIVMSAALCCLVMLAASTARAAVIGEWSFNDRTTLAQALSSSSVATGMTLSSLSVNPSHDFAGLNNVPATDNDGYGFGGNSGEFVMFIHRANYFGSATTWGSGTEKGTSVAQAPLSFTITADATHSVTVESLFADTNPSAALLVEFQEAGAAVGTAGATTSDITAFLTNPIVIGPGQSRTFTVNLNSGNLNSGHMFNALVVNGSVATAIPAPAALPAGAVLLAITALRRRRA